MRILIVSNSLSGGGAERAMNLLANLFTVKGYEVSTLCINQSDEDLVHNKSHLIQLSRNWNDGVIPTLKGFIQFLGFVKKWSPHVVILNCDLPELYGAFAFRARNLICVEHVNQPWINRRKVGFVIRKVLQMRKVTWVAVSDHLTIWPFQVKPAAVIENLVGENVDFESVQSLGRGATKKIPLKRIVFIGRFDPQKQPIKVLQIASTLNVPAVFVGQGKLLAEMEKISNELEVDSQFMGFRRNPWDQIRKGDLLIVPSLFEGDGLVVVEAIMRGVPLLISDIPEFRRFRLPDRNYCSDIQEFCEAIGIYQQDIVSLKVASNKRAELRAMRDPERIYNLWHNLLKRFHD